MVATKKKQLLMTEGPLFGKILIFILPLMATNLLQTFYNAADMMIVGLSSEPDAVGAIGVTGAFITLVVNVFMGFAVGANVVVARHLGAKDDRNASRATHTALVMSLIFGGISAILGLFISRPILSLMGAEGKLLDLATLYTQIYFAGVPFISLTNYLIALFRAKGDTKTPLIILATSGLVNVGLNVFFVMALDFSVEGVSLATTIANAFSAALLLFKLSRDEGACRFSFKRLCFDRTAFRSILYIGVPAAVQGSLFSLSNMIIQSSILQVNNMLCPAGSAYQPVVKGNAAAQNLEGFAYTAQSSVYQGAITFTSQNAGAAKYRRIWRVMACCYAIGIFVAALFSLSLFFLREPLLALYDVHNSTAGSLEAIAYNAAYTRMLFNFLPYAVIALMEIGCGVLRGLGRSLTSTTISLVGACVFRILWISTVFRANPSLNTIYVSYPISWAITGVLQFAFSVLALRHLQNTKKTHEEIHATHAHH